MTISSKAILVIGIVIFVLGFGYFSGRQMNEYRSQQSGLTSDASSLQANDTVLDLSGQQLTTLPEAVLNRTDVTVLNISNNQLTTLPAAIAGMTSLMELNVENNRIEYLPPELTNMTWLDHLDISNNRIPTAEQEKIKSKLNDTEVKT